jgi:hypothetical protein
MSAAKYAWARPISKAGGLPAAGAADDARLGLAARRHPRIMRGVMRDARAAVRASHTHPEPIVLD